MVLAWAVAASAVVAFDGLQALRAFVVLPFVLVAPGWAWVRLARLRSPVVEAAASVLVSLALLLVAAGVALAAQRWAPTFAFAAVTVVAVVGLAVGSFRR